ncbi:hypothetical protein MFIFM68171_02259 [Madurella fahalii]|uniref:Uncharacterized protein n=1 Tax=Madurella fahalii TaxID=1157608 RepID=A0ABQ0G2S0_9PEZI
MAAPNVSEEMLTAIRAGVHPFMLRVLGLSAATQALSDSRVRYDAAMASQLPAPSDARAILGFFGLDAPAVDRVLSAAGQSVFSLPPKTRNAHGGWAFPLSDALEQAYHRSAPPAQHPVPQTYEGYFACGLQQGLRPEFACTVGLHPEDPRFSELQQDFYQMVDPQNASRDKVTSNKYLLDALWCDRMKQEGDESVR